MLYDLTQVVFSIIVSGIMVSAALVAWAVVCLGRMKMFQKAGLAGWKAWIPLYRDYVLCQITMGRGWYFLFSLIPFLMPIMRAIYAIEVTLSYGQNFLFGILYFFFPWACELIAGFGGSVYRGSQDLEGQFRAIFSGNPRDAFRGGNGPYTGTQYTQYHEASGSQSYGPAGGNYCTGPNHTGGGNAYGAPNPNTGNYGSAPNGNGANYGTASNNSGANYCGTQNPNTGNYSSAPNMNGTNYGAAPNHNTANNYSASNANGGNYYGAPNHDAQANSGTDARGAGGSQTSAPDSAHTGNDAQIGQKAAQTAGDQTAGQTKTQQTEPPQSNAQ